MLWLLVLLFLELKIMLKVSMNTTMLSPERNLAIELDDPHQAAGYLVLLSNLYATTRKWLDVATVRQKMVETGVKKPPGRSWVQTDGVIHEFLADDMTHKDRYLIYKLLGEITASIKCDGYEPGILEVLLDNEE